MGLENLDTLIFIVKRIPRLVATAAVQIGHLNSTLQRPFLLKAWSPLDANPKLRLEHILSSEHGVGLVEGPVMSLSHQNHSFPMFESEQDQQQMEIHHSVFVDRLLLSTQTLFFSESIYVEFPSISGTKEAIVFSKLGVFLSHGSHFEYGPTLS